MYRRRGFLGSICSYFCILGALAFGVLILQRLPLEVLVNCYTQQKHSLPTHLCHIKQSRTYIPTSSFTEFSQTPTQSLPPPHPQSPKGQLQGTRDGPVVQRPQNHHSPTPDSLSTSACLALRIPSWKPQKGFGPCSPHMSLWLLAIPGPSPSGPAWRATSPIS